MNVLAVLLMFETVPVASSAEAPLTINAIAAAAATPKTLRMMSPLTSLRSGVKDD
jgi:hypothetical protein